MVGFRHDDPMTNSAKLVAGVASGVITRFVTQPMDVIKVRAQLIKKAKKSRVVTQIATKIWTEEGLTAFWHGHALGQVKFISFYLPLNVGVNSYRVCVYSISELSRPHVLKAY